MDSPPRARHGGLTVFCGGAEGHVQRGLSEAAAGLVRGAVGRGIPAERGVDPAGHAVRRHDGHGRYRSAGHDGGGGAGAGGRGGDGPGVGPDPGDQAGDRDPGAVAGAAAVLGAGVGGGGDRLLRRPLHRIFRRLCRVPDRGQPLAVPADRGSAGPGTVRQHLGRVPGGRLDRGVLFGPVEPVAAHPAAAGARAGGRDRRLKKRRRPTSALIGV